MSFSLLFRRIWINLESFNFLQNNHFLIKIHFFTQNWLFWEKRHYVSDCWSESWFSLIGWSRMIFGLRLEPSITEFGARMTYLPRSSVKGLVGEPTSLDRQVCNTFVISAQVVYIRNSLWLNACLFIRIIFPDLLV